MKIILDNAVSIASLYLGLVGLLSTFFSIHLGEWLNRIQATESKWNQVRNRQPRDNFFSQRLECYYESSSAAAPWTFVGWLAVTVFLIVILIFAEYLRQQLPPESAIVVLKLVDVPCYLFFTIYFLLSLLMLIIGYRKAKTIRQQALANL